MNCVKYIQWQVKSRFVSVSTFYGHKTRFFVMSRLDKIMKCFQLQSASVGLGLAPRPTSSGVAKGAAAALPNHCSYIMIPDDNQHWRRFSKGGRKRIRPPNFLC